jgi:flagellar motor switch protein FliN/FliY
MGDEKNESGEIGDHLSDDELSTLMQELLNDPESGVESADVPSFEEIATQDSPKKVEDEGDLDTLLDVNLTVRVELGRTHMYVEDILHLNDGSVVQLDKLAGDPIDILINERLVARGEVLVLNDNFCVRLTEIVDPEERLR